MLKMRSFSRKTGAEDFSKSFGEIRLTAKQRLIEKCKKAGVSVHIDDASETSGGIYAELRAVASETELEKRLNAKAAVVHAMRANWIAALALAVSLVALVKSFWSS